LPISAVDCVQPALQHTRSQLFTNFRLGQWSRLALVGILAAEVHVGGCGFGNLGSGIPHTQHKVGDGIFRPSTLFSRSSLPDWFPHTAPRISEHIAQFVALIVVGIFVVMVLSFIFLYLNSLFRFILFDAVLQRECSIRAGWQKWRRALSVIPGRADGEGPRPS